jgi:hypothetical protein
MSSINAYEKTVKNDPLLKKYRNKYKNLNKALSNSNNPKFWDLYQTMQDDGPYYIQKYKHGIITLEEFEEWIDSMDFTELENHEALAYKILSKENLPKFKKRNYRIECIEAMYEKFDENKFIYIARFDW